MKRVVVLFCMVLSMNLVAMIGVGTYVPSVGKWQKDTEATKKYFSLNPVLNWSSKFHAYSEQFFCPQIGWSYHLGLEDEYSKHTFMFVYDFGWNVSPGFFIRYGAATFITSISGDGESATLRNGSGYQTFYAPEEAANSFQTTANLGLEYYLHERMSLQSELFVFNLFNTIKRSYAYVVNINFSLF